MDTSSNISCIKSASKVNYYSFPIVFPIFLTSNGSVIGLRVHADLKFSWRNRFFAIPFHRARCCISQARTVSPLGIPIGLFSWSSACGDQDVVSVVPSCEYPSLCFYLTCLLFPGLFLHFSRTCIEKYLDVVQDNVYQRGQKEHSFLHFCRKKSTILTGSLGKKKIE